MNIRPREACHSASVAGQRIGHFKGWFNAGEIAMADAHILSYFSACQIPFAYPPGVIVKIRKSSLLLAAGCTLCVTAASGVVAPQAVAAAPPEPVVSRDVALKASFDPFVIASLPLQNFITAYNTAASVAGNVINPLNTAWAAFAKGDVAGINTALANVVPNEITAISNLLNLPATLIRTDLAAIGLIQNSLAKAETFSAAAPTDSVSAAAAVDPLSAFLVIASLPLQNFITAYNTGAAVFGNVITPLNAAWAAFAKGDVAGINKALNGFFENELAAIAKLFTLPATIISNDLAAINGIFGAAQATALSASPFAATADVSAAAVPDALAGFVGVASLPLQNFISLYNGAAAIAANAINPLNAAWGAFAKGDVAGIGNALNNYFVNELTAINNLRGLPAKIIAQDIATVVGAFGGAVGATGLKSLDAGASTFSATAETNDEQRTGGEATPSGGGNKRPALAQAQQLTAGNTEDQQNADGGGDKAAGPDQNNANVNANAESQGQGAGAQDQIREGKQDEGAGQQGETGGGKQGDAGNDNKDNKGADGKQAQTGDSTGGQTGGDNGDSKSGDGAKKNDTAHSDAGAAKS